VLTALEDLLEAEHYLSARSWFLSGSREPVKTMAEKDFERVLSSGLEAQQTY
jgi:hypothetical protein